MNKDTRSGWKDADWAAYLGCPESAIPEYRRKLDGKFKTAIVQQPQTKKYRLEIYAYDYTSSGKKNIQLIYSGTHLFDKYVDALTDANVNVIPTMELNPAWVKRLGVPPQSMQLLTVKQQQR